MASVVKPCGGCCFVCTPFGEDLQSSVLWSRVGVDSRLAGCRISRGSKSGTLMTFSWFPALLSSAFHYIWLFAVADFSALYYTV